MDKEGYWSKEYAVTLVHGHIIGALEELAVGDAEGAKRMLEMCLHHATLLALFHGTQSIGSPVYKELVTALAAMEEAKETN